MAIKFNTITGARHTNILAKQKADFFKERVKGMRCSKCTQDTIISFAGPYSDMIVEACCEDFEQRVKARL